MLASKQKFSSTCHFFWFQLIDEQVLCVHGGLSPDIKTLDQIRTIERNQEIPHKGAFCDLVWSDPEDVDTWAISPRGAGWLFGSKVTNEVWWIAGFQNFDPQSILCSPVSVTFIQISTVSKFNPVASMVWKKSSSSVSVCAHQQPEANLPRSPAGPWRLQVYVWWEAGDCMVSAKLLLSLREHRLHYGLQRRQQTRTKAVPRCTRLWACHTSKNNHTILPLMTRDGSPFSPEISNLFI